jgi:hypothetical protein
VIGIIPEEQEKMLSEYRIDYSKSVGLTEDQLAQAYAECDILLSQPSMRDWVAILKGKPLAGQC